MSYQDFLATKRFVAPPVGIDYDGELHPSLFAFQADVVRWALRRGRAALFEECGLGKSRQALEWARVVSEHTGRPVLILTPLAVAEQFVREGDAIGVPVHHSRDGQMSDGVNVTNYERLHRVADVGRIGGVVLDESSILKAFDGKTRNALIAAFEATPFRLACTATPAPNDHTELGNHAEFLGVMSRTEMLSSFFVHDGGSTQDWRIKGHARRDFWRWVCSWAVSLRAPSDLGYSDDGYILPELRVEQHVVPNSDAQAHASGMLFAYEARTLQEQRAARRASLAARVELAASIVAREPGEQWLVWCDLNDESAALAAAIDGAVEVKGADSEEHKEGAVVAFTQGGVRALVTKPSIAGFGVNLQNCSRVVFVGLSHSFEAWHQSVRRVWRFGQQREVVVHVVTSEAEGPVVANLRRKQEDAEAMQRGMVAEMADLSRAELSRAARQSDGYEPTRAMRVPSWLLASAAGESDG